MISQYASTQRPLPGVQLQARYDQVLQGLISMAAVQGSTGTRFAILSLPRLRKVMAGGMHAEYLAETMVQCISAAASRKERLTKEELP